MGKRKSGSKATSKRGPRDEPDDDEFVKDEVDDCAPRCSLRSLHLLELT